MRHHDIAVQRLPAYQMVANANLAPPVRDALAKGFITAVIAMSPKSIQILRANIDAAGVDSARKNIDLIAGSDAIAPLLVMDGNMSMSLAIRDEAAFWPLRYCVIGDLI